MKPLLLVDGYNIIGAWSRAVREGWTIEESRDRLQRALEDYAAYAGVEVTLVFDGHHGERKQRSRERTGALTCVFTRQGETADHYIEAVAANHPRYRPLQVATSDNVEQTVVLGRGAVRISAREMLAELTEVRARGAQAHAEDPATRRNPIEARLPPEQREKLERMRRQTD
jgi:predicted RNA-binding protein with PIN domain